MAYLLALLAFGLVLRPATALAQSRVNEGAARELAKKAMGDDYLNTDFDKAAEKLNQAIAKCGTDKCGVPLRAQLKRDLAAVQSGAGHRDQALAAMIDAFHIDAGLQLDPNFKTKELEAIYAEAKKEAKSGGSSGGPPPAGDFSRVDVSEQQVRTPIPIYVEYSGSETLKRVMIKYKGIGMTEWKSLELKAIGSGFGANTPCADSQLGDFLFYIQGFNDQNDPVASGGDRTHPYKVNVKSEAPADPPHLPGQSPPSQCADKGDCPPDFPGCKKGGGDTPSPASDDPSLKGEGDACEEDNECRSGTCKSQKCTAPPESDAGPHRKKFWIGLAGSIDLSLLSSAKDVCALNLPGNTTGAAPGTPINSAGYYCTQNGSDFPTRATTAQAAAIVPGLGDSVGGGLSPGNARILATFDYAFTANQMVGLHAGYVANTYTGSQAAHFPPFHAEARYSYVFGDSPIGKAGLHPFVMGGLGVSEFDSSVSVAVYETNFTSPGASCAAPTGGKCVATVSAWQTAGPLFLQAGGGARWEFVPGIAGLLDLKLVGAIGGSSGFKFIPTPEAGVQFGF